MIEKMKVAIYVHKEKRGDEVLTFYEVIYILGYYKITMNRYLHHLLYISLA